MSEVAEVGEATISEATTGAGAGGGPRAPVRSASEDPGDVAAVAARLRVSVTRLARELRRQGDTGLSPSQISALTSIGRHGPVTLGRLATHEAVAPPSITRVVDKLVQRGLARRVPDPADRRVTRVSTTEAGELLLAEVRARKDLWLASCLAELDDDQRHRLGAAIEVLDVLARRERR